MTTLSSDLRSIGEHCQLHLGATKDAAGDLAGTHAVDTAVAGPLPHRPLLPAAGKVGSHAFAVVGDLERVPAERRRGAEAGRHELAVGVDDRPAPERRVHLGEPRLRVGYGAVCRAAALPVPL